jgi:hypothetical protein
MIIESTPENFYIQNIYTNTVYLGPTMATRLLEGISPFTTKKPFTMASSYYTICSKHIAYSLFPITIAVKKNIFIRIFKTFLECYSNWSVVVSRGCRE